MRGLACRGRHSNESILAVYLVFAFPDPASVSGQDKSPIPAAHFSAPSSLIPAIAHNFPCSAHTLCVDVDRASAPLLRGHQPSAWPAEKLNFFRKNALKTKQLAEVSPKPKKTGQLKMTKNTRNSKKPPFRLRNPLPIRKCEANTSTYPSALLHLSPEPLNPQPRPEAQSKCVVSSAQRVSHANARLKRDACPVGLEAVVPLESTQHLPAEASSCASHAHST